MPEPTAPAGSPRWSSQEGPGKPDPGKSWEAAHALLFTGHMIDVPDRPVARFPAWAEGRVREAIHRAIENVAWTTPGPTIGLAGAASGGDLLFHECCRELGIPTRILLALPPEPYEAASVAPAGPEWVRRFRSLLQLAGPESCIIQDTESFGQEQGQDVWQRANLWMLDRARIIAPEQALLAVWDGQEGDGPGGTWQFIGAAREAGVRILPQIRMQDLLDRNQA